MVLQAEGAGIGVHEEVGIGVIEDVYNLEVRPVTSNNAAIFSESVGQFLLIGRYQFLSQNAGICSSFDYSPRLSTLVTA